MVKERKPVHKVQMTEGKRNIIRQLLQEYEIESAQDIQDALKDLLGGTIKEMMEAEMDRRQRWTTISVMKNLNALTAMITETATNPSRSTAAMAVWRSRFPRTESPLSSHRS